MKPPAAAIAKLRPVLCPGADRLVAATAEQTAGRSGPQSEMAVTRGQAMTQKKMTHPTPKAANCHRPPRAVDDTIDEKEDGMGRDVLEIALWSWRLSRGLLIGAAAAARFAPQRENRPYCVG